ncbi:MAG: xanthine dehydrogenase family protein molybdopterin-binding subunit, partial [Gammaproteobacteria bacterium]|nr:xanthine dehydrogenase family protein molybdopterin-binding subunit [Gammaproteobacteria bacterium]
MKRREFLVAGGTVAGGFWLGATLPEAVFAAISGRFNAYLEIGADGTIHITCPQSEMGQGIHDGLPKILAEELAARWEDVRVRMPSADDAFINPITKRHRTANSESTNIYFGLLRTTGAAARDMLIAAAAQRWSVPAAECRASASRVTHAASGRSASYGELAAAAAALPVPSAPVLKDPKEFTLIGRATPRKDTPAKVDGSLIFGIDVALPGMLHAALRRSPTVASKVLSFDRDAALSLPGVVDAFVVPDGIAVVANSTWNARRAAEALDATFDDTAAQNVDTDGMRARLRKALDDDAKALAGRPMPGFPAFDKAATMAALESAARRLQWEYEVPFLAHAALEPLCATAVVRADEAEVWAPTQQPDRTRDMLAQITGLPRERCKLHVTFLGGGFGRKWEVDFVRQAVQIAKGVAATRPGTAVKLTWTREQDFRHDRFRPAHLVRTRAGLDAEGKLVAMHSRTTGISMWKYHGRPSVPGMADPFAAGWLINDNYRFPNKYIDYVETPEPVPVGTWRSVSQSMNCFFSESAIDDVAFATKRDPLELRLEMCASDARATAVLRKAAELASWGKKLPKGRGRGIALALGYDSYCAEVVEVTVKNRQVKIERIIAVFDCGMMIDPRNVDAQVEGGVIWGLSAAIDGQITFANGAAVEDNFHTSPILRINQTPRIEVHLLKTEHKSGGAGEASVPGVAPALASA